MKFIQSSKGFFIGEPTSISDRLPKGAYRLSYNGREERLYFIPTKLEYDKLVDLPSPEFTEIMNEMNVFLSPPTKKAYIDHGFVYKRSIFLHGAPGTGKSCIVNRVSEKVENMGGIIIFNDNPQVTIMALEILKMSNPDLLTMVIFEEFDQILEEGGEEDMLRLLDGQVQKNNVIYLATTNFLDKIPKRMLRPGRFSRTIEVFPPNIEARTAYINLVSKDKSIVNALSETTDGFTIDELKEAVLSINCLGYSMISAVDRIKETSELIDKLKRNSKEQDVDVEELFNVFTNPF